MKAYQIVEWGAPLEQREVPVPEPTGTEVLIKVTACGICHSDIHIWDGYFDLGDGNKITLQERGLVFATSQPVATETMPIVLDGVDGPEHWVGFRNFYVITRYNRSAMYALAVFQLGEAVAAKYHTEANVAP